MYVASIPVHRIVATAFHGPQPSKDHIVEHIDTNRRNNRPENLRWVTRLENILLNPITRRGVELAYGSIENFLANPAQPTSGKLPPDFDWMRSVTKKEAEECRRRLLDWAKSGRIPSGGTLGEWLYKSPTEQYVEEPEPDDLIESRTPGAIQKNWKTPSEFPLCPSEIGANALDEYRERLKKGEVFSRNDFGESIVVSAELSESSETLVVLCKHPGGVKDSALARVWVEDRLFVHESLGTFFTLEGATKQYVLKRGLKWEGGDTIDDYC
ncbi:MAG: HNH endonuclease signature motif containing protein [Desulfobacterales bacterium]|nr:HNH endonuclease signature motif containing protein [Desulfobacterales bacterium]